MSGGNPFYALELARALGADGAVRDPTQPLPVPERLEELVSARLDGFEAPTREVLVLASADARLTPAQLAGAGIEPDALDPALAANVIELAGGSVRLTHPLLASVLYQGLPADERQRVHRRLAEIAEDPLARARHLALSTDRPDADLAALLEAAARTTAAQGAPMVSAELGEHAMRLTPPKRRADLDRRTAAAARSHLAAGDVERGRVLAAELAARAAPGADRAEALVLLAEAEDMPRAVPLLKEALQEPGAPAALRASIHQRLSLDVRFLEGLDAAEEHARAAVELAEQVGDAALRASALGGLALIQLNAGRPGALELAEQAYELVRGGEVSQAVADVAFPFAHVLVWSTQFDRARALLESLHADWSERDERMAAYALWYLAMVELRTGNYALAEQHARQSRQLNGPYVRDEVASPTSLFPLTLIAAHRGDLLRARELAEEMLPTVGAPRGAPARAADDARDRRVLERVSGRSRRLLQVGGRDDGRGRRRRTDDAAVAGRAGRGAARARPRGRGGRPSGSRGRLLRGGSIAPGRWRTPPAAAASSRRRGGTSRRR